MKKISDINKGWWLLAGVFAIVTFYYFLDPLQTKFMPQCSFHALTGYDCPGCGLQRMLHALFHGNLHQAWLANPFLMCLSPFFILMIIVDFKRKSWPGLYRNLNSPLMISILMASIIAWWFFRNI